MAGHREAGPSHRGDLVEGGEYEGLRFAEVAFDEPAAGGCHFLDCAFVNVSFGGGRLRRSRFTDTRLRDTRFVATDLAETRWQDAVLAGCALAGVQAFSAALRRVTIRDGKLDSVNFRSSTLTDVTFENCLLRDVDFGGATLERVSFGGCTLTGADFTKVTCTDVDLRGAGLGIAAGFESLRGVTIDSVQLVGLAPQLAHHLGITVETAGALLPRRPGPGARAGAQPARRPLRSRHRRAPFTGGRRGRPGAGLRQRGADPPPDGRRVPGHRD